MSNDKNSVGVVEDKSTPKRGLKRTFGNCDNCPRERCAIWFLNGRLLCRACRDAYKGPTHSLTQQSDVELLPCPACGAAAFGPFHAYEGAQPEDQKYVISCTKQTTCGLMLSGVNLKTPALAIAAWNRRADTRSVEAGVEGLKITLRNEAREAQERQNRNTGQMVELNERDTLRSSIAEREAEIAQAMAALNPANSEESLIGAIRNLQQAHLSEAGNVETVESILAGVEAERDALRDALTDLVRQLPQDERLADYNLDQAEAAMLFGEQAETKES
jgi:hypothetical protein